MSRPLSCNRGIVSWNSLIRWYKSSRNFPCSIICFRSTFVAVIMRMFTSMMRELPTGLIIPSCRARNSCICTSGERFPISSRNSVPPSAISKAPFLSLIAEVKDPFRCPNNSLEAKSLGIAPQSSATNGPSRRVLFW